VVGWRGALGGVAPFRLRRKKSPHTNTLPPLLRRSCASKRTRLGPARRSRCRVCGVWCAPRARSAPQLPPCCWRPRRRRRRCV
jgi:hypothetical protein